MLECLDLALVLLGRRTTGERAEVLPLPVRTFPARIEAIFARFQIPDHQGQKRSARTMVRLLQTSMNQARIAQLKAQNGAL
jgi:hypothetical protein